MGRAFNENVQMIIETREKNLVDALPGFLDGKPKFVLAKTDAPTTAAQLSFAVVGNAPDEVEAYLDERTRSDVKDSPFKHAFADMKAVYHLAKPGSEHPKLLGGFTNPERTPLGGCCSRSEGVSVLIVHKPEGADEFQQLVLMNKTILCDLETDADQPEVMKKAILSMSIQDA